MLLSHVMLLLRRLWSWRRRRLLLLGIAIIGWWLSQGSLRWGRGWYGDSSQRGKRIDTRISAAITRRFTHPVKLRLDLTFEDIQRHLKTIEDIRRHLKTLEDIRKTFAKIRRHSKTFEDILHSKTFKDFWKLLKIFLKTFEDIWRDSKTFEDIWRHSKAFEDIRRHLKTFEDIQRHLKTFEDIRRHSKTFEDVQRHLTFANLTFEDFRKLLKTFEDIWRHSKTFEDIEDFWRLSKTIIFLTWDSWGKICHLQLWYPVLCHCKDSPKCCPLTPMWHDKLPIVSSIPSWLVQFSFCRLPYCQDPFHPTELPHA